MPTKPLEQREGFAQVDHHPVTDELRELAKRHGLIGAVLITFGEDDKLAVTSTGRGTFGQAVHDLATKLMTAIDDGMFDPTEGEKPN